MPIDPAALSEALEAARAAYRGGPTAVRTGGVIQPLHQFCAMELARLPVPRELIHPLNSARTGRKRLRLLGAYMPKEVDVAVVAPDSGPLIAISVKSQMSSIAKNTINRFEEYVGDATNLHTRFPMLVLGFMMLVPVCAETFGAGGPTDALKRIAALLERSNARKVITEPSGSYEVSCLMAVDFDAPQPKPLDDYPARGSLLRVETFFDRLWTLYQERNQFVKLEKP